MGGTRNHIDRFWPPHIFVCSCPKPGPRFPLLDVEVFLCSIIWDQRWLCSLCVSYYYWWQYRPSLFKLSYINVDRYKHTLEKKWQSRMDNPEKLVTLGTQDDPKKIINKHRKLKIWATLTPPKPHPPKKNPQKWAQAVAKGNHFLLLSKGWLKFCCCRCIHAYMITKTTYISLKGD